MKNMIRNTILAAAVVATAALASSSAMASTLKVPFSFTVGDKQCPAGTYTVKRSGPDGSLVTLASREGTRNFTWILRPGEPVADGNTVVMRFEAQGENHVLESIHYKSQATSSLTKKTGRTEYTAVSISAGEGR